jgi:hypothetical protein
MQHAVGLPWVMVLLSALSVLAILFVLRFLPETKGMSVEEVVSLFEEQATDNREPAR